MKIVGMILSFLGVSWVVIAIMESPLDGGILVLGLIAIGAGYALIRKGGLKAETRPFDSGTVGAGADSPTAPTKTQPDDPKKTVTIPRAIGEYKLKYHYTGEKIAIPNIKNCLEVVESAIKLSFENEPTNEYDDKAIKIMAGEKFLGYVHKGKIQDMIHDFNKRNDPIYALLETVNEDTGEACIFIAFYKNPFEQYARCESLTAKLTKTSKRIDEFGNRQDNFFAVERGDTLCLDYDRETETYVVTDGSGGELGEISKSISDKIQERESEDEPICIVDEVTEDDNGKCGARVIVYFK